MAKYGPSEILYVPIEVAKYNHKGCCINFFGDILKPVFEFPNNSHGVDFFISKVTGVVRASKIKKILMGLESTGHYHRNLTLHLRALGHDVAVINPFDSWKERLNKNAKTDKIDLGSIAIELRYKAVGNISNTFNTLIIRYPSTVKIFLFIPLC